MRRFLGAGWHVPLAARRPKSHGARHANNDERAHYSHLDVAGYPAQDLVLVLIKVMGSSPSIAECRCLAAARVPVCVGVLLRPDRALAMNAKSAIARLTSSMIGWRHRNLIESEQSEWPASLY